MNTSDILERIHATSKMNEETGCEIYRGTLNNNGYGQIYYGGKMCTAHRVVYEAAIGEIPLGFDVHHTCGERACCRIDHLQAISHQLNVALTKKYTALRCRRLKALVASNLDLHFFGVTQVTSTELRHIWDMKHLSSRNLSDYLKTIENVFKGDFEYTLIREGRGNRPHLYEIRIKPELIKRVESYHGDASQTNFLAALITLPAEF